MSDLDRVQRLIANGEKENAIALLASILLKNKNELEAWVLLGDTIDDPARKKDCYQQVLRLAPRNFHALTRLQELQEAAGGAQLAGFEASQTGARPTTGEMRKISNYIPDRNLYRSSGDSTNSAEIVVYLVGGIAAFLVILYVIGNADDPSSLGDSLLIGLVLLSLIAGIIMFSVSSRNRG